MHTVITGGPFRLLAVVVFGMAPIGCAVNDTDSASRFNATRMASTTSLAIDRSVVWRDGKLASDYKTQDQDVIELTVGDDDHRISISQSNGRTLSISKQTVQFPYWAGLLKNYIALEIADIRSNAVIFKGNLCFKDPCPENGDKLLRLGGKTALGMEKELSSIPKVRSRILPKAPGILNAGNQVNIMLSYNYRGEFLRDLRGLSTEIMVQTMFVTSSVEDDGQLRVPRISLNAGNETNFLECDRLKPDCGSSPPLNAIWSDGRATLASLEKSLSRVRVRDGPQGNAFPLWRVERCLNAGRWKTGVNTANIEERNWCRSAGVDDRFLPNQNSANWVELPRYDLQVAPSNWHLVDVKGLTHEIPYQYGISIQEAVTSSYARMTGRELIDETIYIDEKLLVSVYPFSGKTFSFYLIPGKDSPELTSVGLASGDRIFVKITREQ